MKNRIIKISLLIALILVGTMTKSYGAFTSKPAPAANANHVAVRTTIQNSYLQCKNMTNGGESLAGATVKPHLATNKDWGAVSYLSNSIYGTNTAGANKGTEIEINGIKYYSTNGNASGVMNWGSNPYKSNMYTQTAGLISNYTSGNDNVAQLYTDRETDTVDFINPQAASQTLGMAMQETNNMFSVPFYTGTSTSYPGSIRIGLFGGGFGDNFVNRYGISASGAPYDNVTFRPVIWN